MYLCRCNNCDEIWEDINPSEDSFDFDPDELDETYFPLELFEDEDGKFWGCPICETDAYLIDFKNERFYEFVCS